MLSPAVVVAIWVALPPPLCRGKVYDRYDPHLDKDPSPRALAEVQAAYDALCPEKNCGDGKLFENETIGNNAVTWVSGLNDGSRTRAKIVYSARFLNALATSFGAGASFGVLAHEVGHHLTAALSLRRNEEASNWDEELRADYLAGCALGRSGRSSSELENALRALASVASKTHPAFDMRNTVVRKGYETCVAELAAMHGPGFGIGAQLKVRQKHEGCWTYGYRSKADVARIGPIAAELKHSRPFKNRGECEADRNRRPTIEKQTSVECTCE